MIDSILTAESGLRGFQQGLRTISNNTANLNTPGFKSARSQFADLAGGTDGTNDAGNAHFNQAGRGLSVLGTTVNFARGDLRSTSHPLDLAIDGQGFFTFKASNGEIRYSQDGQFKFDKDGMLVSVTTEEQVMALNASGNLVPISLTDTETTAAQATTVIKFAGNLSSTATTDSIANVTVIDSSGSTHTLTLGFQPDAAAPGSWTVTLNDGSTIVGASTLKFSNGQAVSGSDVLTFSYAPTGATATSIDLDFSSNVTSFDSGSTSTLAVASQNGLAFGTLTGKAFDSTGTLVLTYSNGKTVKSGQLALAQFDSPDNVEELSNNQYAAKNGVAWRQGVAGSGQFGVIQSSMLEGSNVDLSQEFSDLVIMQRGYQASSQVISTASDMLTALFGIMSK